VLRAWTRITGSQQTEDVFADQYDLDGEMEGARTKTADPAPWNEEVELWMWLPRLIMVLSMTCIIMRKEFHMPIVEVLPLLFLAIFSSFLASQPTCTTAKSKFP